MLSTNFISGLEREFGVRLDVTRHELRKQWFVLVSDGHYRSGWAQSEEDVREIAKVGK